MENDVTIGMDLFGLWQASHIFILQQLQEEGHGRRYVTRNFIHFSIGVWHLSGTCPNGHHETPVHRYLIQLSACDATASTWMGGFDEVGKIMYNMSGDQFNEMEINEVGHD